MVKIILLTLLLQGCASTFVGVAYHPEIDRPEYSGSNPMFILRGEKDVEGLTLFCEHISSIPDVENGYGLNMCGAGVKF